MSECNENNALEEVFAKIASSHMNNWVGGQDAFKSGMASASLVKSLVRPKSDSKILDFGCGISRVAAALSEGDRNIAITGVDIASDMIDFCNSEIAPLLPKSRFYCLDGSNPLYDSFSPATSVKMPESVFLNGHQNYFNAIYTFSVFTHMTEEMSLKYLSELAGVLANSGAMLISAFLLDAMSRKLILDGRTEYPQFFKAFRGGESVFISDDKLELVAYDIGTFSDILSAAGLCIQAVVAGRWRGIPSMSGFPSLQDLVLVRPLAQLPKDFDPGLYLEMHPDVRASGMGAKAHYLSYGFYDDWPYLPEMINPLPDDFDAFRYVSMYPDLLSAKVDGAKHYRMVGAKECRAYR